MWKKNHMIQFVNKNNITKTLSREKALMKKKKKKKERKERKEKNIRTAWK